MESLGALIKEFREKAGWPQRKLAYKLDVDVSVLSKIENDSKFPKKRVPEIINIISDLFGVSKEELKQMYLSDEIANMLMYEKGFEEILKVSEEKVHYGRQKTSIQSNLKFSNDSN